VCFLYSHNCNLSNMHINKCSIIGKIIGSNNDNDEYQTRITIIENVTLTL